MSRLASFVANHAAGAGSANNFAVSPQVAFLDDIIDLTVQHLLRDFATECDIGRMRDVEGRALPQFVLGIIEHLAKRGIGLKKFFI